MQVRLAATVVLAALVSASLFNGMVQYTPAASPQASPQTATSSFVDTTYRIATATGSGFLSSGQSADIMLSGIGFDNAGGSLLLNHPSGIATDGQHLLVADRDNNRILVWNNIPAGDVQPDLVLGQKNFTTNNPGHGLDGLNWPTQVSTANGKVVAADSYNNRILIWNSFPTRNGQPADLELVGPGQSGPSTNPLTNINWPWGAWTDGTKLVVASTGASLVLIWNTFPTKDNQSADLSLTASGKFGTPRQVTSDGKHLVVGDHNSRTVSPSAAGTFVWNTFPTANDQPYDYFALSTSAWGQNSADWARGAILPSGQTLLLGGALYIFNSFPMNNSTKPDVVVSYGNNGFSAGDGGDLAVAGSKLYLDLYNPNLLAGFNSIPTSSSASADFVIGSTSLSVNTLNANYFFTNPVPRTDGKSLFVASDFDKALYAYRHLPRQSNAYPDVVYQFADIQPWDIALYNNSLALAGGKDVLVWKSTTEVLNGQPPDLHFSQSLGNVTFQDLRGVALDAHHFYLSDRSAGKVYVWNGIPSSSSVSPSVTLSTDGPTRLWSDGNYLAVTATESGPGGSVRVYSVAGLASKSQPNSLGGAGLFNLPQDAIVAQGHLFVGDTGFNRVLIWKNMTSALSGSSPDIVLGCTTSTSTCINDPEIGKDRLFWPAGLAFDGNYLWVGEFKFSGRLLKFDVGIPSSPTPRTEFYDIQAGSSAFTASLKTDTLTSVMKFSDHGRSLTVNTTGTAAAYVNATFPTAMLDGTVTATVDGSNSALQQSHNSTHTSVYVSLPSGIHTVRILGTTAVVEVTSTATSTTQITSTSFASSTAASTSTTPPPGGPSMVMISPTNGPNGTVVTISGSGLSPGHSYAYCFAAGAPPPPPAPVSPCPAGAPTFTAKADGTIPSSPAVTLRIVGVPGQYTVEVGDPTSPFVVPLNFIMTATAVSTTAASTTASAIPTTSAFSTTSTSSSPSVTQPATTTASQTPSSSSSRTATTASGGVPEYPPQVLFVLAFAFVIAASYALRRRRK